MEIQPNEHRPAHAHGFDARLFVLDGHLTPVLGNDRQVYGPDMTCNVPTGTVHEEHTGSDGVHYVAVRQSGQRAQAAQ